jgi:hypothetical protein
LKPVWPGAAGGTAAVSIGKASCRRTAPGKKAAIGPARNDLRQLAMGLLWLHRNGMDALMKQRPTSQLPTDAERVSR